MRNLVLIFLRFGHFILFILLELVCLYLIVNYNQKQRDIWGNSSNIFKGYFSEKWNDWTNYFSLEEKMDELAKENALLKERLINVGLSPIPEIDTSTYIAKNYELISAKVTNNSISQPNNYITFNKGRKDGVAPDMGVIGDNGIVGIIRSVKENYSIANSILHRRSFISAMIKRTGAYGDLKWIDTNPRYVNLESIEKYHDVRVGDSIVTSGYSSHFPIDLLIGVIEEKGVEGGGNFYKIKVELSNDFSALRYVEIIKNYNQEQQLELEKEVRDE